MIVVGGGVIGLELGSVYARLGTQVEVVEYADKILLSFDNEVSSLFKKLCEKEG
jgi:dihydrolipoamide dehydrogenase